MDKAKDKQGQAEPNGEGAPEPQKPEPKKPEQVDWEQEAKKWKGFSREWEDRAKKNADAAKEFQEIKDADKSDLEKAIERADKAEKKAARLEHQSEVERWKADAGKRFGVDPSILRGDTEREIAEHAEQIKGAMRLYSPVDPGKPAQPKLSRDKIMSIQDPKERKAAIAANLDLF